MNLQIHVQCVKVGPEAGAWAHGVGLVAAEGRLAAFVWFWYGGSILDYLVSGTHSLWITISGFP